MKDSLLPILILTALISTLLLISSIRSIQNRDRQIQRLKKELRHQDRLSVIRQHEEYIESHKRTIASIMADTFKIRHHYKDGKVYTMKGDAESIMYYNKEIAMHRHYVFVIMDSIRCEAENNLAEFKANYKK